MKTQFGIMSVNVYTLIQTRYMCPYCGSVESVVSTTTNQSYDRDPEEAILEQGGEYGILHYSNLPDGHAGAEKALYEHMRHCSKKEGKSQ